MVSCAKIQVSRRKASTNIKSRCFKRKNNNNTHIEKLEPETGHFMTTSGKVACTTPKREELEEKDSEFLSSDNVDQQMHAAKEDTSIEIGNGQQAN